MKITFNRKEKKDIKIAWNYYKYFIFAAIFFSYSYFLIFKTKELVDKNKIETFIKPALKTNVQLPINYVKSFFYSSKDPLIIDISYRNVLEIAKDREKVKAKNSLLSKDVDWVDAKIKYLDDTYKVKMRLKGWGPDHWQDDGLWSYKIKVGEDKTILGMKRFAIQHPRVRHYMSEWYFSKLNKYAGIVSPRIMFIPVVLNGKSYPIYSIEENMEKYILENNNRREGPIFKLGGSRDNLKVLFYRENKLMKTEKGRSSMNQIRRLINSFDNNELEVDEVFDVEAMGMILAISDLLGSDHSINRANLRYYLNPITGLIEPIPFDHEGIYPLTEEVKNIRLPGLIGERFRQMDLDSERKFFKSKRDLKRGKIFRGIASDLLSHSAISKSYGRSLEIVSNKNWLDNFFKEIKPEESKNLALLHKSYPWYSFRNKETLYENQEYIRSKLKPNYAIKALLLNNSQKNEEYQLLISNKHSLPLELKSVVSESGKTLYEFPNNTYLPNSTDYCSENQCYVLGKKKKKYKSFQYNFNSIIPIKNPKILYEVAGSKISSYDQIYTTDETTQLKKDLNTLQFFDFIKLDKDNKQIYFLPGEWEVNFDIKIPKDYNLKISENTTLNLTNNASIISYGPINIIGSKNSPVIIKSTDQSGQGIAVINANKTSNISNTIFQGLNSFNKNGITYTGAITFFRSDVNINSVSFEENNSEDAINIIRSGVNIKDSIFKNIFSDAIDLDFSTGEISNILLENIGNDGIDVSGTEVKIKNIKMRNISDKGLSVGENSNAKIKNVEITDSYIGIASKDNSIITGNNIQINNANYGIASYQKKPEYSGATIILDNLVLYPELNKFLVEKNSTIKINKQNIKEKTNNVFDLLYSSESNK
tara:strand:- start:5124 stop:7751 length:2628 start_codon:yes stop_codon:yes gene_type:complete